MRHKCATCLALTLGLLAARVSLAQDLETSRSSATGTALGGTEVVAAAEADTLWANPAGLTRAGWNLVASLSLQNTQRSVFRLSPQVNEPLPEARDLAGTQLAPALALALPLGKTGAHVGLGYHTGLLLASTYLTGGEPSPVRYIGSEMTLRQHVISVGFGLRWRWIAVGLALQISHLRLQHGHALWAGLEADSDRLQEAELDLTAAFSGQNTLSLLGLFGLRARPLRWLALGLAFRPPVDMTLRGKLELSPPSSTPRGYSALAPEGGPARLDLGLPLELHLGASLILRRLRLHLEARHQRWSATRDPVLDLKSAAIVLTDSSKKQSSWPLEQLPLALRPQDHTSFHLGLELPRLVGLLTARLGYAYHLGGTAADAPGSTLLDLDRHVLGLGLEARRGALRVAIAVQHSFRSELEADGGQALLYNPLDPEVTEVVGQGRFASASTRVVVELGLGW